MNNVTPENGLGNRFREAKVARKYELVLEKIQQVLCPSKQRVLLLNSKQRPMMKEAKNVSQTMILSFFNTE